jgi:purine-binding chemotaxis protein CheW
MADRGWSPAPEEQRAILRARARVLAQEPTQEAVEELVQVVEFALANEHYAVESSYVSEVQPLRDFTPLPGTPPFVLGIISRRGEIISVLDVRKFFNIPSQGLTNLNKVIVVHADQMEVGIMADDVLGVRLLRSSGIQPAPPTLTGIRDQCLKGVTEAGLVVLDIKKLLSDRNMVAHEQADL